MPTHKSSAWTDLQVLALYLDGLLEGGFIENNLVSSEYCDAILPANHQWEPAVIIRPVIKRLLKSYEERRGEPFNKEIGEFEKGGKWHRIVNNLQADLEETRKAMGLAADEDYPRNLPLGDWSFAGFMNVARGTWTTKIDGMPPKHWWQKK